MLKKISRQWKRKMGLKVKKYKQLALHQLCFVLSQFDNSYVSTQPKRL